MKNLLEAAEDYTKQAGWRDLAELKCCMCALGLLLGLAVPRRWRKKAGRGAAALFAAACIPQAAKFPSDPSKRICTFVVKSLTTHSLFTPSTPPASPHIPRSVM